MGSSYPATLISWNNVVSFFFAAPFLCGEVQKEIKKFQKSLAFGEKKVESILMAVEGIFMEFPLTVQICCGRSRPACTTHGEIKSFLLEQI